MTWVKVCGLRERAHLDAARDADAVGFVVASPRSPRNLALDEAAALARLALQETVAVTAARDAPTLLDIMERVRPRALQAPLGADAQAVRDAFPDARILLACRPEDAPLAARADALVLDATTPDGYGGTGHRADWTLARKTRDALSLPIVLAGGLTPDNVADAIRLVQPHGVDVSSGVETHGRKDPHKIRAFVRTAKEATP